MEASKQATQDPFSELVAVNSTHSKQLLRTAWFCNTKQAKPPGTLPTIVLPRLRCHMQTRPGAFQSRNLHSVQINTKHTQIRFSIFVALKRSNSVCVLFRGQQKLFTSIEMQ